MPPLCANPFVRVVLLAVCLLGLATKSAGQSSRDTVLEVTATTSDTAPHITLEWITPGGVTVTAQQLWKRVKGSASWGTAITLDPADISYPDPDALPGVTYEYSIRRTRSGTPSSVYGAIVAGHNVPLVESRGNVCLLVDQTMSLALAPELTQLVNNLTADGWVVFRHDVPRQVVAASSSNSADWPVRIAEQSAIRAIVQADYNSAPGVPWALFIFGRIPVPYSGNIAPDGHGDHIGAWSTDGYYGDVDGTWNDTSVNNTSASDARNDNVPGDGKFDHGTFPSPIELMTGRVDLANMTGVPSGQTETGLLRQYLVRDHRFRRGEGPYASVAARAIFDDNFGYFSGEAFSGSAYRAAIGFFGRSAGQVDAMDWFTTLGATSVLFGYGNGGGSYTSASGVGSSTTNFGRTDSKAVFTCLFGSYHGDWDVANNFLRSPLAGTQDSLGLTCSWSGRSHHHYYHMAMGETAGYAMRFSQNATGNTTNGDWFQNSFSGKGVQINLMGDPTLRLHTVRPPIRVAATSGANVQLTWQHSPDAVAGYHVYRGTSAGGPFTRLTGTAASGSDPLGSPSSSNSYTDTTAVVGTTYFYQVKAARLETSASGTYANQSLGETVSVTHGTPAPAAPTGLAVAATSATAFALAWEDNAATETGYEVQRRDETTGVWATIAMLGANTTTYSDGAVSAGVANHYRVRALGSVANSAFSAEAADSNQTGIIRTSQDYMLVAKNVGTLPTPLTRFSGSRGAASVFWSITDFMSSPADYTEGTGVGSWSHLQSGPRNLSLGIKNHVSHELTKIFRVNVAGASGSVLGAPATSFVQVFDTAVRTLPSPWTGQAVGSVTQAGYTEHLNGTFGISAVTGSIADAADSFNGIHQQVTGDCRIGVRISARSPAATSMRAGIMIRSALTANAVMCAAVSTSATNLQRAFRTTTGGTADTALSQTTPVLPLWLRLTRIGDEITIERLSDGTEWTAFGTPITLTGLGASPYVSVVMASNTASTATYGYARFDEVFVHVMPAVPGVITAGPGAQPGEVALSWSPVAGAESYTIERSTSSGGEYVTIGQVSAPSFTDTKRTSGLTYFYRVNAGNPTFQSAFSAEASAMPYDPPTPDGWTYRHFGAKANSTMAADDADPDADGLPNLVETALGQSPLAANPQARLVPGRTNISGSEYLTLTFVRDTTLTGVTLMAESTASLAGTWTQFDPLAPANQLSVLPNTPAPGLETITIKDVQAVAPGGSRFMRLRATRP